MPVRVTVGAGDCHAPHVPFEARLIVRMCWSRSTTQTSSEPLLRKATAGLLIVRTSVPVGACVHVPSVDGVAGFHGATQAEPTRVAARVTDPSGARAAVGPAVIVDVPTVTQAVQPPLVVQLRDTICLLVFRANTSIRPFRPPR